MVGLNASTGDRIWFAKSPIDGNASADVVLGDGVVYALGGYPVRASIAIQPKGLRQIGFRAEKSHCQQHEICFEYFFTVGYLGHFPVASLAFPLDSRRTQAGDVTRTVADKFFR